MATCSWPAFAERPGLAATGNDIFRTITEEVLDYARREIRLGIHHSPRC
jgi:hypothetical protein